MECSASSNQKSFHVILIYGGMSAEREISISSAQGVAQALIENGHMVTKVDMGSNIGTVLASLQTNPRDTLVFNCLHGTYGEDGCLPGLLNIMSIPYTHSGLVASALALNKKLAHNMFVSHNIPTPNTKFISKKDFDWSKYEDPMTRPYIIKPYSQGSSIGVHLVFPEDSFCMQHDYEFKYGETVLVQQYIKGREINVVVLNGVSIGMIEVKFINGKRFYDYETKYTAGFVEYLIPVQLPKEKSTEILQLSEKVYNLFECRGLCRIEFILSDQLELFVLELNTHPGMTPMSLSPKIARHAGISYNELVETMLLSAQCDSH